MREERKRRWQELVASYRNGGISSTTELAETYLGLYPDDGAALIIVGDMYISSARYEEALRALRKASKLVHEKRLDLVYKQFGRLYKQKGNYRVAEKWYRKAIESNPNSSENYTCLGDLLSKSGRLDEAKELHEKSANLNHDSWDEAHFNLGLIYRTERNYEKALQHFEKAIEIDPRYIEAIEERDDIIKAIDIKNRQSSYSQAYNSSGN